MTVKLQKQHNLVDSEMTGSDGVQSWKKITLVTRERRPRWFGHVWRMDEDKLSRQTIQREQDTVKRKARRPRKNWSDTVRQDLILTP